MNKTQHISNSPELGALSVADTECDGQERIVSIWRPTREELNMLNDGGTVALCVAGRIMPPVVLPVDSAG